MNMALLYGKRKRGLVSVFITCAARLSCLTGPTADGSFPTFHSEQEARGAGWLKLTGEDNWLCPKCAAQKRAHAAATRR